MVDSVAVLPPGERLTDLNGDLVAGGVLSFFVSETDTPLEVFSAADLGAPSTLGVTVDLDSAGYPVTDANARTLIYTGSAPYKIRLKDSAGVTIWEHDKVKGALDTSGFLTSSFTPLKSIVPTAIDRAITAADRGKLIDVNCSAGALTMTITAAATLGNGWWVGIRHAGTANQVKIAGNGTDLFSVNAASTTAFSLTNIGQVAYIVCDGAGFRIDGQVPTKILGVDIIKIVDRLSIPPGSPSPGERYIITASPTGAWSSFSEHDVVEADGQGGWFKYSLFNDSGILAYVSDENRYYSQTSGWKETAVNIGSLTATTSLQDADLIQIERSGVNMKVTRPNAFNERFITSGTVSAAATLDLTIPADCDVMEIDLWGWVPATDDVSLFMRFSQSGSFLAGASDYRWGGTFAAVAQGDSADSEIEVAQRWGNVGGEYGHGTIRIFRPSTAGIHKFATFKINHHNLLGTYIEDSGGGDFVLNTNAIDGVRLLFGSGNIAAGFYFVRAYKYT